MRSFQLEVVPRRDGCLVGDFKQAAEETYLRGFYEVSLRWRYGFYGFFSGAGVFGSAIFDFSMGPGFSVGAEPLRGNFFSCRSSRDP